MALETMLIKVKTVIFSSSSSPPPSPTSLGVLSFEIAGVMSKLVNLWRFLSELKSSSESITVLEGVRKIISNDDSFLVTLTCAETLQTLRALAEPVSRTAARSSIVTSDSFPAIFREFAETGRDPRGWSLPWREMESLVKKMERLAGNTAALHREMEELAAAEQCLRKSSNSNSNSNSNNGVRSIEAHQKVTWRRQEVKYLKERSLWSRSFDSVASLLVRSIFTVLARAKTVFGLNNARLLVPVRSLSAAVHPSESVPCAGNLEKKNTESKQENSILDESTRVIREPPETTLGAAGLAVHYAGVVMVMERMIKSPQLVGPEGRDDLYSMLPASIRSALRSRLRGVGFCATDPSLAAEWRSALSRILSWLSPLAHNMIRWHNDRSLEHNNNNNNNNHHQAGGGGNGVLLLETLFFANTHKTEAAITELLVGLNYIWRFEREMTAKAFFESHLISSNKNNVLFVGGGGGGDTVVSVN